MLKTRVLVAVVALPILIAIILVGDWAFALLVTGALLLAADEYFRLFKKADMRPPEWLTFVFVLLAVGAVWFDHDDWREPGMMILIIVGLIYAIWGMEHGSTHPITDLSLAVFGGVYLGWLGSTLLAVRMLDDGAYLTLFLYGCVIMSDSAAYFVGRQWGKHRLSPHVSPKKSWEGYIGSVIGGLVFGALGALVNPNVLPVGHGALIGLLIGILGTAGDLGESVIKRQVGAKDSGHLIPGHGGILDRLDSVLISAAIGYYYLVWFVV
ncbi:MAG TPA: phosphatidate cytidylyltransferase [Aggregatilineaceae bacterium]|nr:phosphatidate cytidylyltransferase [Aggregatilineaceae bacterium]